MTDEEKRDIWAELREPFPAAEVKWRPQSGRNLAYIDARSVQIRLDKVLGPPSWKTEFIDWGKNGIICKLSIWCAEAEAWVTKQDGADRTQIEAEKGGISDSFKRAAVMWGVGRYLYDLPTDAGKNLPDWALPESEHKKPIAETKPKAAPKAKAKPKADIADEHDLALSAAASARGDMAQHHGNALLSGIDEGNGEGLDSRVADLETAIEGAQSRSDLTRIKAEIVEARHEVGESAYSELLAQALARFGELPLPSPQAPSGDQG